MKKNVLISAIFILIFGIFSFVDFFYFKEKSSAPEKKYLEVSGARFEIEIADTEAKRKAGLSGREGIAQNQGMLFVFKKPGLYAFWMKDMKFPIDIIWIDEELKIAGITANIAMSTYPKTFYPPRQILFVLEIEAGAAEKNSIASGDFVQFK